MSNKPEPAAIDVAALARRDEFCTSLGIQFVEASLGRAVTRVTIEQRHLNFNGVGHGGLTFTLADAAFYIRCVKTGEQLPASYPVALLNRNVADIAAQP